MGSKYNPFEILKNLPYIDEEFLREITGLNLPNTGDVFGSFGGAKWPPVNIIETAGEIIVTAEIPGLQNNSDVTVELTGNTLKLEGETSSGFRSLESIKVHKEERRKGKFSRTVSLPAPVDNKNTWATYRYGVLEVRFKKTSDSLHRLNVDFKY